MFLRNRVVVVGDLMLDITARGSATRLAPEACIPITLCNNIQRTPGGAANVAINLYKTQAFKTVAVVGAVGDDEHGVCLKEQLQGLDLRGLVTEKGFTTTTKHRTFVGDRMVSRYDTEVTFSGHFKIYDIHVDKHTIVLISDYDKGVVKQAQDLLKLAHDAGALIVCDPKNNVDLYQYVNILKPNNFELDVLNNGHQDAREIFRKLPNLRQVVLTQGSKGITLLNKDGTTSHAENPAGTTARNVVGAGDTVAVMMCLLLQNKDIIVDAEILTSTGAAAVAFDGVLQLNESSVTFLRRKLPAHKLLCVDSDYMYVPEKITALQRSANAKNQRIVLCNGNFDIVHVGHLSLLTRAKALGDILVVALDSDDNVSAQKGKARPIMSLSDRVRYMCMLPFVDYVIGFDGKIQKMIEHLKPYFLVKGDDYTLSQIVGKEHVKHTVVLSRLQYHSTTNVIARCRL